MQQAIHVIHNAILAFGRWGNRAFGAEACARVLMVLLLYCLVISAASVGASSSVFSPLSKPSSPAVSMRKAQALKGSTTNPYPAQSWQWTLFNATATFMGLPAMVSTVDGLQDEGQGFHADGSTRRAGGGDFSGQRAVSYLRYGQGNSPQSWLYSSLEDTQRDHNGRLWNMGSEYSRSRVQGASNMDNFRGNAVNSLLQRGISAGMGLANSAAESAVLGLMGGGSPYGSGKARFNFDVYIDAKGASRLGGEGDLLLPLYDNLHTTIYAQLGARSMFSGGAPHGPDRWIGNVGVGQRWFPDVRLAEDGSVLSSNWMLGYNAFYDHDITRGHQRGGVGLEAQYDWLKLASNWYLPISDWKNSHDFDSSFVEERAAQGWDLRLKGYIPFYRELAVTGSFTQWYGEHVGMFGPAKLEKDPRVWSYGLEYTPVPALTAYVNQRQTERAHAETEFGLRFTYTFGMDAGEQFKPSRVAEMRTVQGARHDFVDRENAIILEYRAKNKFHIEYLGHLGGAFVFRVLDGFQKHAVGQMVLVQAGGGVITLAEHTTTPDGYFATAGAFFAKMFAAGNAWAAEVTQHYTTDAVGIFRVIVMPDTSQLDYLKLQTGETILELTRPQLGLGPKQTVTFGSSATTLPNGSTATMTLAKAPSNIAVTWAVVSGPATLSAQQTTTDAQGQATATLTANTSGTGTVTVKATADGTDYTCTVTVSGPTTLAAAATTVDNAVATTITLSNAPVHSTVTWALESGPATLTNMQTDTGTSGQATATLTGNAHGTGAAKIKVTVGGNTYDCTVTVTGTITIGASAKPIANNATAVITLTNGPINTAITWAVTGPGTLSNQQTTTDANGQATAILTANASGTGDAVVTATVGGVGYPCTVEVNGTGTLTPSLTSITGGQTSTISLSNGPVNTPVSWVLSGPGTLSASQPNTSATGDSSVTLTANATGTGDITITATVGTKTFTTTVTVTGTPTITPTVPSITNGSTTGITLANGPVNSTITWTVTGPGTLSSPQSTTDAHGQSTITLTGFTSGTGIVTVTANVSGATPCTVTVTGTTSLTSAPASIANGGVATLTLTNGPIQSAVTWALVSGPGNLSNQMGTTTGTGQATATLTGFTKGTGTVTVSATVSGTTYICTINVTGTVTFTPAAPTLIGSTSTTITLDNSLINTPVTWSILSGPGSLSNQQGTTDATGTATASLTANATGTGDVTVQAVVGSTTYTSKVTVKGPGIIITTSTVGGFSGGVATATVTAKVHDAADVGISGQTVTWSVLSATNNSRAMASGWGSKKTGLAWGATHNGVADSSAGATELADTSATSSATGETIVYLSDIVGQRNITLRGTVTMGGTTYTVDTVLTFGNGPLAAFASPYKGMAVWNRSATNCGGTAGNLNLAGPQPNTKLPSIAQIQAVAAGTNGLKGAAFSAGWSAGLPYWSSEAEGYAGRALAWNVTLIGGTISLGSTQSPGAQQGSYACIP